MALGSTRMATRSPRPSAGLSEDVLSQNGRRLAARRPVIAVENLGVQVDAVRPGDGAGHLIDEHLSELDRIPKGFKDASMQHRPQVELPDEPVREGQPQAELPEGLDLDDPRRSAHCSTRLPEGFHREEGVGYLGPPPVLD